MSNDKVLDFKNAVKSIKDAILRSRFQAAIHVNREILSLYYAVGRYVSENSRVGVWGTGAIKKLSDDLQKELPGLRGFGEVSLKKMRLFYEEWVVVFTNRPLAMDDLNYDIEPLNRHLPNDDLTESVGSIIRHLVNDDLHTTPTNENRALIMHELEIVEGGDDVIDLVLLQRQIDGFSGSGFSIDHFLHVSFTNHSEILAKEKSLNGRLFYIAKCATEFWTLETLKAHLRGNLYGKLGTMPSNFMQTLPDGEQARRASQTFREDYLLDHVNIEDMEDPDERVFEKIIITNIKKFILTFGNKFCFIGDQYRVIVAEKEYFIDLLFFHRELHCLVAVELKRGEFKPSHLGQLNFYLSALDDFVRQSDEAPSIGILLCKEADRSTVEYAVRDYTKPMGVATYKTRSDMPETLQKALPDTDEMIKLLDNINEEDEVTEQ